MRATSSPVVLFVMVRMAFLSFSDACHLFASSLVRDGEDGVLVVFVCRMPDESGEHEGGMSGTLLYIAHGILKLSGPGVVWGICQLLVGEEGVVVTDIAVGIGYLITEVIGIDVGRVSLNSVVQV